MHCTTPAPSGLSEIAELLAAWQPPGGHVSQLHPGDLGWFQRFGSEATAAAVRCWQRDGATLAVGLQDEPDYLRLALAPDGRDRNGNAVAAVTVWSAGFTAQPPIRALIRPS